MLVDLFRVDLERHHPNISSLHLPDPVSQAWKQRVRTLPSGRPRRNVHTVLRLVRSFYLDLWQWSLEDPARWAAWAAPCPIGEADVRGYVKETRQRQARMQQRTRTLIPVLPRLVTAAGEYLDRARQLLDTIRDVRPGQQFTVAGERFQRAGRELSHWRAQRPCSPSRSTGPGRASMSNALKTTPSGPGQSSKSCIAPAPASRSCSN